MTTTETVRTEGAEASGARAPTSGDHAVSLAGIVAGYAEGRRGDLAALRRMDPDDPDAAAFWRLRADLPGGTAAESKWALILHGIALMTPTSGDGRTAHNGQMSVGQALFLGAETQREKGFYSEMRLNRLLTARGDMLRTLLPRMFRMLASENVSFNWREMANFILASDFDEDLAERARRRIARDYYRAERRNTQTPNNQNDN